MRTSTFILREPRDRAFAIRAVTLAAEGAQVRLSKPTRTLEQNSWLHSVLTDLSKQLRWPHPDGELHDVNWWKRRATLGWLKESKYQPDLVEDLDGETFGILLPHTSDLNVSQCAALIEWVYALGSPLGVVWTEPKRGPDPPPPEIDR